MNPNILASIVSDAAQIHGWMCEEELRWLANAASSKSRIVEVGSWCGRSTKALAGATDGLVFAVDHWSGSASERASTHQEAAVLGANEIFRRFCQNLAPEIRAGKLVPIRQDSALAATSLLEILGSSGADMVFIDAEHTYESVYQDITNFRKICGKGTLLCGHDYGHDPVTRAVRDTIGEVRNAAGSIWATET